MDRRGFTLVEMLVVIALLALVGGLAISFVLSTIGIREKAQHRMEVQENTRLALTRIEYEIRRARGIELTSDFGVNLATTGGSTLDLDMATGGNDPTTFDVVNGVLRVKQGVNPAVALTTNDVVVSDFTLQNRSTANGRSRNIALTLTIEHVAGVAGVLGGDTTVSTTIELRGL